MLKHRIIPILLTDGQGNCVKPVRFERPYRKVGSLMQYVKVLEKRNIDELIIIDIEATKEGRLIDCEKIKEYTKELFCPVTLGGGIKSLEDINKLLQSGADKVAIKNMSFKPIWLYSASQKFGAQCITVVMDIVISDQIPNAKLFEKWGAGEILLNKPNCEGVMEGYGLDYVSKVSKSVSIPVIANCGAGSPEHMKQAIEAGASAVAASSMFLYTDITPRDCAEYLKKEGVPVRV